MYHPYSPKNHAACPGAIKETFGVSDKRWMWLLVRARSRLRDWDLIVQNTARKGFFSSTHESPIGFLPICQALQENGAPIDLIATYARLISDLEDKVKFCTQIGLYDVAVEVRAVFRFILTCCIGVLIAPASGVYRRPRPRSFACAGFSHCDQAWAQCSTTCHDSTSTRRRNQERNVVLKHTLH
jgi:hypothetical protein